MKRQIASSLFVLFAFVLACVGLTEAELRRETTLDAKTGQTSVLEYEATPGIPPPSTETDIETEREQLRSHYATATLQLQEIRDGASALQARMDGAVARMDTILGTPNPALESLPELRKAVKALAADVKALAQDLKRTAEGVDRLAALEQKELPVLRRLVGEAQQP